MESPSARPITVHRARLGEEDARLDREFWNRMTPGERVLERWRLLLGESG